VLELALGLAQAGDGLVIAAVEGVQACLEHGGGTLAPGSTLTAKHSHVGGDGEV
jgi:hypothetical protein